MRNLRFLKTIPFSKNSLIIMTNQTSVKYICRKGYTLMGVDTLNLKKKGMWDNIPPICVSIQ